MTPQPPGAAADDWERLRRRARILLVAAAVALGVVGVLSAAAIWGVGAWLVDRTIDGAIEDERLGR